MTSTLTTTTTHPIPLGVYVGTDDADTSALIATYDASIASFATLMGETPLFTDVGANSNDPVSGWLGDAQWDANAWAATPDARQMTPVIGLPMASFAAGAETGDQMFQDFIAGKYDSLITGGVEAWAQAGATTQYWRPGWEMNLLSSMPWYGGTNAQTSADFVAAFQHIYTVLHQAGTEYGVNVQVIWDPGTTNYGAVNATTALFPGANYVDLIGADVYQIDSPSASEIANGQATTLQQLLNLAVATGKPFCIPEAGNSTNSPAFAQWLAQTLAQSSASIAFVNLWDSGSYAFSGSTATQPALAAAFSEYFGANAVNPLLGSIAGSVLNGTTGVAGATVTLLSSSATVVATTTTNSAGAFSFASVTAGNYQVSYAAPSGLVLQNGSQANITTGLTSTITVPVGQAVTLPAELVLSNPGTIQSTVLHFGASTDPLGGSAEAGVTVSLLNASGSVLATTVSNSAGAFSFTNLAAGTYQLQYTPLAGQAIEPGTSATTAPITLAAGQTINAPGGDMITLASLSGSALVAGAADAGVTVSLLNAAGTSVASTTTAANGTYSFANDIMPGTYTVIYTAPKGQVLQTGSQANISTGVTAPFTVAASQVVSLPAELLLTNPASIVVQTKHFDGPTDPTWGGVDAGVVTQLLNSAGQVIATSATNASAGWLSFIDLAPGTYQVLYQVPTGQAIYQASSPLTAPITVTAGQSITAPGGEFISLGTIGGSVTASGAAVAGMAMTLLTSSGTAVATTTTGSTGTYSFANLAAGSYEVQYTAPQGLILQSGSTANASTGLTPVQTLGIGQTLTLANETLLPAPATLAGSVIYAGTGDAGLAVSLIGPSGTTVATTTTNSAGSFQFAGVAAGSYQVQYSDNATTQIFGSGPANSTTGLSAAQILTAGQTLTLASETLLPAPASLGGAVTYAGAADAGETVSLIGSSGATLATTTTNNAGSFAFTSLAPGNYQVQYAANATQQFASGPAASSSGLTGAISLTPGQTVTLAAEALVAAPATLTGAVVYAGAGESGLAVSLIGPSGATLATTTTNSAGSFQFAGVAAGSYEVQYSDNATTQIFGTGPANSTTGLTAAQSLTPGETLTLASETLLPAPAALGGAVTYAGAADAGVTVALIGAGGATIATATTNAAGNYEFGGLAVGSYEVLFPASSATLFAAGPANSSTGLTASISLTAGQTMTLATEALVAAPATLTGAVTFAAAADAGETVSLLSASGATVTTTTTNSAGGFQFTSLAAGSYALAYNDTPATQVFASGPASTATGITPSISLTAGQTLAIATEDLEPAPATLAGSVSYAGAGDAGLMISLIGSAGSAIATTTTDSTGSFQFTGLAAGAYQIQYSDNPTTQLYGSGPASSSTGLSAAVSLTAGQTLTLAPETLLPAPASIAGTVTYAGGADSGITVALLSTAGTTLATTTTNSAGNFTFSGLSAGSYMVQYSGNATQVLGSGAASSSTGLTTSVSLNPGQAITLATETMLPAPATLSGSLTYQGIAESGVAVSLLNASGAVQATAATDVNGDFAFSGLAAGTYDVQYAAPSGQMLGSGPAGGNGLTAAQTLTPGETLNLTTENLLSAAASLSGSVQISTTGSSPSAAAGEDVSLLNAAGTVVATTVSQNNGYFQFSGVTAGTYSVQYSSPSGATAELGGAANPATGQTGSISLAAGQSVALATQQLLSTPASITASVDYRGTTNWAQIGETVELLNSTGSVLATGVTNSAGTVSFGGLVAGSYKLDYLSPTGDIIASGPSGINTTTGVTSAFSVAAGAKVTESAEYLSPASNSNLVAYVYAANAAGVSTAVANATVTLLDAAGDTLASELTNAWGGVNFYWLNAGTYQLRYSAPSGETLQAGSAASATTGLTSPITLAAGQSLTVTPETFVAATGVLSGSVQTSSGGAATALAGVNVALLNASGTVVASTTTGSTGSFQFTALAGGSYQVQYTAPSGQSMALGGLANPATGLTSAISLGSGQTVALAAEQMLSLPGSISGVVQHTGAGDAGTGQSGVSVALLNAAGTTIGSTTTSGTGAFSFSNLAAGSYQLLYTTPAGEAITAGSAANPSTGLSAMLTLGAAASLTVASTQLTSTSNIFTLSGSGASAVRAAGNYVVTGNAANGNLALGAGNQSVALTGGNDTITTGAGNSTISALAGGNTITAGAGMNFITVDAKSGNVFNLNSGAQGVTSISGFTTAGDILDLNATLSGLSIAANLSNLGSYVTATVNNGSTTLAVDPTPGAGTPVNFAILNGVSTSVAQLITGHAISLS